MNVKKWSLTCRRRTQLQESTVGGRRDRIPARPACIGRDCKRHSGAGTVPDGGGTQRRRGTDSMLASTCSRR